MAFDMVNGVRALYLHPGKTSMDVYNETENESLINV